MNEKADKSAEFLNLTTPPEPSSTPDPSTLFPLKRRSSSNYKSALLTHQMDKTKISGDSAGAGASRGPTGLNFSNYNYNANGPASVHSSAQDDEVDPLKEEAYSPSVGSNAGGASGSGSSAGTPDFSPEVSKRSLQRGSISCMEDSDGSNSCFNVNYNSHKCGGSSSGSGSANATKESNILSNLHNIHTNIHNNIHNHLPSFDYSEFKRKMSPKSEK